MESIWFKDYQYRSLPQIKENIDTELLIIGGGIAGLMTAYNLMKNNIRFILVEGDVIAGGVSSKTTAKLSVGHDTFYQKIKKIHGIKVAKEYYESQIKGLELIKDIISKEEIDCDFQEEDTYIYTTTAKGLKTLDKEERVLKAINANIKIVKEINKPLKLKEAIVYKDQAIFNPMKYMMGILTIIQEKRTPLYENSRVTNIKKVNDIYEVTINNQFIIRTKKIVMACHYPILNPANLYFTKIYQSSSYAIAFKTNLKIDNNYICVDPPYYTLRKYNDNTLIMAGSDHYSGIDINFKTCFKKLENKIYSLDKNAKIVNKWWTEDCMPIDSLPFVGQYSRFHKNILLITGFGKWGFTNSHIGAQNITKMLLDEEFETIYRTNRWVLFKNFKNTIRMISHSIEGLIISRIAIKHAKLSSIKLGSGKVLKLNNINVLAYRKDTNGYIILKNKCTHLGCTLIWNDVSKVWQSKCHGSVFDVYGNVLEGPAVYPLERIN